MEWLTTKEIKIAAGESDLAALKCVQAHWKQIRQASATNLIAAIDAGKVTMGANYCAACERNVYMHGSTDDKVDCSKCIMPVKCDNNGYREIIKTFNGFLNGKHKYAAVLEKIDTFLKMIDDAIKHIPLIQIFPAAGTIITLKYRDQIVKVQLKISHCPHDGHLVYTAYVINNSVMSWGKSVCLHCGEMLLTTTSRGDRIFTPAGLKVLFRDNWDIIEVQNA